MDKTGVTQYMAADNYIAEQAQAQHWFTVGVGETTSCPTHPVPQSFPLPSSSDAMI